MEFLPIEQACAELGIGYEDMLNLVIMGVVAAHSFTCGSAAGDGALFVYRPDIEALFDTDVDWIECADNNESR